MNSFTIFAFLLIISVVSAFHLGGIRNDSLPVVAEKAAGLYARITNGQYAIHDQFKYQVSLVMDRLYGHRLECGGSLISSDWVLTAAHCIIDAGTIHVMIGGLLYLHPEVMYTVTRHDTIYHTDYQRHTHVHDIGVVNIPPVLLLNSIYTVRLPTRAHIYPNYVGENATLSGFGRTSDLTHDTSPSLMYCELTIIANRVCEGFFTVGAVYGGKMCTSSVNRISGCDGDSGGPLVFKRHNIQVGIASFRDPRGCELGYPYAFTRVDAYLSWINLHTGLWV